jgi:hypothetical protein
VPAQRGRRPRPGAVRNALLNMHSLAMRYQVRSRRSARHSPTRTSRSWLPR